jgi:predicted MFS family arabinose efflux permease
MNATGEKSATRTTEGKRPAQASFSATHRLAGAVVIASLFMGSTLVTPLYELYRARYHLDELMLVLLYAVYVVGNLSALLFFGRLSDQLGRRPVVLAGLGLAAVSAAVFGRRSCGTARTAWSSRSARSTAFRSRTCSCSRRSSPADP